MQVDSLEMILKFEWLEYRIFERDILGKLLKCLGVPHVLKNNLLLPEECTSLEPL